MTVGKLLVTGVRPLSQRKCHRDAGTTHCGRQESRATTPTNSPAWNKRRHARALLTATFTYAAIALLGACRPAVDWEPPEDLQVLVDAGDMDGALALAESKLRENIGKPFPELQLQDKDGNQVALHEFDGEPLALFIAGGPCPHTSKWMKLLSDDDWNVPGYRLIILVKLFDIPEHMLDMRGFTGPVLKYEWPFPSYLTYVRFHPLVLFLNTDGTLGGYQLWDKPVVDASNNAAID